MPRSARARYRDSLWTLAPASGKEKEIAEDTSEEKDFNFQNILGQKLSKAEIRELKIKQKQEKKLKINNKKASKNKKQKTDNNISEAIEKNETSESELLEKLSKLTKEQRDILFKLLDK